MFREFSLMASIVSCAHSKVPIAHFCDLVPFKSTKCKIHYGDTNYPQAQVFDLCFIPNYGFKILLLNFRLDMQEIHHNRNRERLK